MKKLLTLLLVAALAVASFGVLTACKKDGGATTLEGEWYYTVDNAFASMGGDSSASAMAAGDTTPTMPNVSAEYTLTIAKLADADKTGEFEGKDYATVMAIKFNTAGLSETDRATVVTIMQGAGAKLLADNNMYMIMPVIAFAKADDGVYTSAFEDSEMISKAEYKDNKLNITLGSGSYAQNADWKYRAAGTAPDVAGEWKATAYGYDIVIEAKTTGEDKNTVAIGQYVYVPLKEAVDDITAAVMFKVGDKMYGNAEGITVELNKQ